jgi:chaperone required for assembly of F1-ATPase
VLLAEKEINAEEAFKFSFYEELTQQKKWGVLPEAEEKHQAVKLQLKALERWLNERSVS